MVHQAHCSYFGFIKSGLTRFSIARKAVEGDNNSSVDPKVLGTSKSGDDSLTSPASSPPNKKKKSKSKLLLSKSIWVTVRTVASGQERQQGSRLSYQTTSLVLTIQLFTNTILIESFKRSECDSLRKTYPIDASFKDIDLKSYYQRITGLDDWRNLLGIDLFKKGFIRPHDYPLTIPTVTLPFRLPGFKLDVTRQMLKDLNVLMEIKGDRLIELESITLAKVRLTETNNGKETFEIGDYVLNKITVRELRPILNSLTCSYRLTNKVLNLIKIYFKILKSALFDLLNKTSGKTNTKEE